MSEEKQFPSFGVEDQEMAHELKPAVIGPPAYASPDPNTNAGALVPVEDHPFELGKDYGGNVPDTVSQGAGLNTESADAAGSRQKLSAAKPDEDREEWTKDQWSDQAEKYGLAKSGTKDEVRARVEEYEANPPDNNSNPDDQS